MKQTFLSIKDHKSFKHKRSNDFYRTLKKAVLKNFKIVHKIVKVLLKVIQRINDKNPEMHEVIDASMMEVCAKEGISPEQVLLLSLS